MPSPTQLLLHFLLSLTFIQESSSSYPPSQPDISTYHPVAQLPALQIDHRPSSNKPEPELSISEVYLHVYCPIKPGGTDGNAARISVSCLALRGETCTGVQTQIYFHLWHSLLDPNPSPPSSHQIQPKSQIRSKELEKQKTGSQATLLQTEVSVEELPGYADVLSSATSGRGVVLATGAGEKALRRRFNKVGQQARPLVIESEVRGREKRGRGESLIQRFVEGEDLRGLVKAGLRWQVRRMRAKRRRMGRWVRRAVGWVEVVKEEGMRMWQEGEVGEVWGKGMRMWQEGEVGEVLGRLDGWWVWEVGVCLGVQWAVGRLVGRIGRLGWSNWGEKMA